jgi:hypothetical protein
MKLVDGVALYGAGKWSENRKLAFSSYSYRTSVDLKVCLTVCLETDSLRHLFALKHVDYSG